MSRGATKKHDAKMFRDPINYGLGKKQALRHNRPIAIAAAASKPAALWLSSCSVASIRRYAVHDTDQIESYDTCSSVTDEKRGSDDFQTDRHTQRHYTSHVVGVNKPAKRRCHSSLSTCDYLPYAGLKFHRAALTQIKLIWH